MEQSGAGLLMVSRLCIAGKEEGTRWDAVMPQLEVGEDAEIEEVRLPRSPQCVFYQRTAHDSNRTQPLLAVTWLLLFLFLLLSLQLLETFCMSISYCRYFIQQAGSMEMYTVARVRRTRRGNTC